MMKHICLRRNNIKDRRFQHSLLINEANNVPNWSLEEPLLPLAPPAFISQVTMGTNITGANYLLMNKFDFFDVNCAFIEEIK